MENIENAFALIFSAEKKTRILGYSILEIVFSPKEISDYVESVWGELIALTGWNWKRLITSQNLDLSNKNLRTIPTGVNKLHNLKRLYITNNKIKLDEEDIIQLSNPTLHTVQLQSNCICELPEDIGKLHNLWSLSLDGNTIREGFEHLAGLDLHCISISRTNNFEYNNIQTMLPNTIIYIF